MGHDARRILLVGAAEVLPDALLEPLREAFTRSGYEVHTEAPALSQAAARAVEARPDAVVVCASSVEPGGAGLRLARFVRHLPVISGRAPVLLASPDVRIRSMGEAAVRAGLADRTIALPLASADALVSSVEQAVSAGPVPSSRTRVLMDWLPALGGGLLLVAFIAARLEDSAPEPVRALIGYPVRPALALLGSGLLLVGSVFQLRDPAAVRTRASSGLGAALGAAFVALMLFGLLGLLG